MFYMMEMGWYFIENSALPPCHVLAPLPNFLDYMGSDGGEGPAWVALVVLGSLAGLS